MARFTRFRNTFPVIDDIGAIAFANAFGGVRNETVCAFEVARIGVALTEWSGGGDTVWWVVAFLLLGVGVDL